MAEMIDRETLKKAIDTWDRFYYVPLQGVKRGCNDDYTALVRIDDILHCIDNMPAADVQPIRHGRWIDHEKFERKNCNVCIECSVCNTWFGHDCIPKTMFCPNCGARMDLKDGEKNEND